MFLVNIRLKKRVIKFFLKNKMLKCCRDRYKTQKMCDKTVDACLPESKSFLDLLFTSKMLEIFDNVVFSNDNIDLHYIKSDIVTLFSDYTDININLDEDLETMIHVKIVAWHNKLKQREAFKREISNELMLVAWHSTKW